MVFKCFTDDDSMQRKLFCVFLMCGFMLLFMITSVGWSLPTSFSSMPYGAQFYCVASLICLVAALTFSSCSVQPRQTSLFRTSLFEPLSKLLLSMHSFRLLLSCSFALGSQFFSDTDPSASSTLNPGV